MSLNWKEIDLILSELDLAGCQIQKVIQSGFDVLALRVYGRGGARTLLAVIRSGVCRLHETFRDIPANDKPLRFGELLKSRILNGRIEEAVQLGGDRIVRLAIRRGEMRYLLYFRLWSNAANVLLCEPDGRIIDAMRRLPKRGETAGGSYRPEQATVRKDDSRYAVRELDGEGSFSERIDRWYAEQGGTLSLDALKAEASRRFEGAISRLEAALERLREKEADYSDAARLKEYGDIIMANMHLFPPQPAGTGWIEAEDFYDRHIPAAYAKRPSRSAGSGAKDDVGMPARSAFGCRLSLLSAAYAKRPPQSKGDGPEHSHEYAAAERTSGAGSACIIRIAIDPKKSATENAAVYYGRYRKAKSGLDSVREAIAEAEAEIARQKGLLERLLGETNPFRLQKLAGGAKREAGHEAAGRTGREQKRPGLTFRRDGWLMIVGRSAKENDELLRRHVKGNDLWLHARDAAGSYVFIKQRPGKTVPLPVLLDAANLALFYSKGRNAGRGELFYTQAKYLRRAKNGPKGLVIPTQEKNLSVTLDDRRLKELEGCRE